MKTDALAGTVVARDFDGWSPRLVEEFTANAHNRRVGGALLSETDAVRVWDIRLELDYFWTAVTAGRGRQHVDDGTTREVSYTAGETRHLTFGPGEYLLHDLENIGDTTLIFVTVEHKR